MKQKLVEHIICPKCHSIFKLNIRKKVNNEILEGALICTKGHKFPIKCGIPRLVVDRELDFLLTEDAFSAKWKRFNKTTHDKKWYEIQKKWFLERFGWKNLINFHKFLETRTKILDAGTGVGNSAKLLSHNSESEIFAIDASASIEFAYKKFGNKHNIHFLQADIRQLPFRKKFFDFICSDQVLHHTKDTQSSFKMLTKLLAKNGLISIYVYRKKSPMREFSDDFIRKHTVNMSEKECIKFSKDMASLGKNLSLLKRKIKIPRDIPILQIKAGIYDVQRFIYWNFLKCWWSSDVPFDHSVAVNFDWYFPKYAYRHTENEVRKWFKDTKLRIVHFDEIESGYSITGKK